MAKKRFISSILLCAFAVLFAHSIIPHHHQDEIKISHHNDHHNDDDDDLDNNYLGQVFSRFQHEGSSGIIYQAASSTFQCSTCSLDKEAVLLTQYLIRQVFKPPVVHAAHFSFAFISSRYSVAPLLRGPPAA